MGEFTMLNQRAADIAGRAAELSEKATYTSGIFTVLSGLALNEWAAIVGIIVTIGTGLVNWYYRAKHVRLLEQRLKYKKPALSDYDQ